MATFPLSAKAVFDEAFEIASPDERRNYLERACAGAPVLRQEVEALLSAYADAGSFLETPPARPRDSVDLRPHAERPGTMIGPFKLLQQIGEGGMGVVWMAEQTQPVRRQVALKVIKPGMDSRQVVARFEAERQALAVMDHVNIARVFDGGATDAGLPYFVMELVHGVPITQYCDDNRLTARERLELFVPVCQAIQHAHQKGIIHRDIKPSNVMVTLCDGRPVPKVIDFGVARATEQKLSDRTLFTQCGALVGTLEYMSPEQAEMSALGVDTRSDIFSLGVLLYELLTGSTPLTHARMKQAVQAEILRLIKEEEPQKPSTRLSDSGAELASISANRNTEPARLTKLMRGDLDWILLKCLEKDRTRRYETANGLAADITRHLNDETVTAGAPSARYKLRKFVKRNRARVIAAAIVAGVLVLGVVGTTTGMVWALNEKDRASTAFERAEANLTLALQALDQIYIEEAEGHPKIRAGLPRDLLQKGLGFYEAFVNENAGNMLLVGQMGLAYQRAGLIFRALGDEKRAVDNFHRALSAYDHAIEVDSRDAVAHNGRANALQGLGRFEEELAAYDRAIEIDPRSAFANNNRGAVLLDLGRFEEALAACDRLLEIEPRSASAHNNRGNGLHKLRRFEESLAACDRALEIDPRYAGAHDNRGIALHGLGRFEEALAAQDRAIEIDPQLALAHTSRGDTLRDLGRPEAALESCDRAIEIDPRYGGAYNSRGNTLCDLGRFEEALAAYDRALEIDPRSASAHNNRGNTLCVLGRFEDALAAHERAIEIDPQNALGHANRASALNSLRRFEEALAACARALEIDPRDATAHANRGIALGSKGDDEAAIGAFREAIRFQPDVPDVLCNLGRALTYRGRFQEAVPYLRRGHELGSRRADWALPSAKWIEDAERNAELEGRLDQVLSGAERPRDTVERIAFAEMLYATSRHALSVRMYMQAFAEDAALAEDLAKSHRYNAVCSAALAVASGGADAAESRGRALEWLRADLAARVRVATGLVETLEHWKRDADLASVRDRPCDLPESERAAWQGLWAAVDAALATARQTSR